MERDQVKLATERAIEALLATNPPFGDLLDRLGSLGRVALVGGAPRDWALGSTPRDIDIVVDAAPSRIADAVVPYSNGTTGLGGQRLRIGGLACDVWALCDTWALSRSVDRLAIGLEGLPKTAFLNVDAVAVEVGTWRVHEHGFFDAWRRKELHINFAPNPRPVVCIAHAISMATRLGFRLSEGLAAYAVEQLEASVTWKAVFDVYASRYASSLNARLLEGFLHGLSGGPAAAALRCSLADGIDSILSGAARSPEARVQE